MGHHIKKHIKSNNLTGLPEEIRTLLKTARLKRGLSQFKLGELVGLPQMHISHIESGKTAPRFTTILELARVLGCDFLLVPRSLVPAVQSLIREQENESAPRPLYADDSETNEDDSKHDETE